MWYATSFQVAVRVLLMVACGFAFLTSPATSQEESDIPRVWIYRDASSEDTDNRSQSERHFTPYFLFPESKASKIVVNAKRPISDISPDEEGTCIEFFFELEGGDDFAGAGFIPGDKLGAKLPLNVVDEGLVVGFGRPVYLKFRARTEADQTVRIRFESCGLAAGRVRDGVRPAQTPKPEVTVLTDSWQDVTIDLTGKSSGLENVASPLRVVVRSNENPRRSDVTVFVDDVRFEVGRPTK